MWRAYQGKLERSGNAVLGWFNYGIGENKMRGVVGDVAFQQLCPEELSRRP